MGSCSILLISMSMQHSFLSILLLGAICITNVVGIGDKIYVGKCSVGANDNVSTGFYALPATISDLHTPPDCKSACNDKGGCDLYEHEMPGCTCRCYEQQFPK